VLDLFILLEMTKQILSNLKTNFDIHLNNAITKGNYISRMKKFMKYCQVESYDELLFGNDPKIFQSMIVDFLITRNPRINLYQFNFIQISLNNT
jgi:hypothetical protein